MLFVLTPNVFSAACRVQGIVRERRLSHTDIRVCVHISEGGRLSHTDIRVQIYICTHSKYVIHHPPTHTHTNTHTNLEGL